MAIKKIDSDVEVTVMNNTHGSFIYEGRNSDMVIDLEQFGDEEYVTFGELKKLVSSKKSIMEKAKLLIVDVNDDEVTVDDVVAALRLTDTYNELHSISPDGYSPEMLKEYILNTDASQIERVLKSKKSKLRVSLLETAVVMFRLNQLTDYNKMRVFAESCNRADFQNYWKDTEVTEDALDTIKNNVTWI